MPCRPPRNDRTTRMHQPHRRPFLTLALLALSAVAPAQPVPADLPLLTCAVPLDDRSRYANWEQLKPRATEGPDGELRLAGTLRMGELCIQDVQVVAAFGVALVSATLCTSTEEPLLKYIQTSRSGWSRVKDEERPPGVLAVFDAPEETNLIIYRGSLDKPDASSRVLGYTCTKKYSGHQ